jgi:DNA-binding PadR family transcriptional regulator
MVDSRSDILQGTLDLMVLKTLDQMGPLHGYGLALRIEQVSQNALRASVETPKTRNSRRSWMPIFG